MLVVKIPQLTLIKKKKPSLCHKKIAIIDVSQKSKPTSTKNILDRCRSKNLSTNVGRKNFGKLAKKISPTKVGQKNPRWHHPKNSISRCWLKNINSWSRPKNFGRYCPKNSLEQSWSKNTLTNIIWKITLVGVSWKTSSAKVSQKNSRQHRPKK